MAAKRDPRAEKERKQKIFLAIGGVLLIGVLAFQAPKLLSHKKSAAAPATTPGSTTPGSTTPGATTPSSTPSAPTAVPTKYSAQLAGVVITPAAPPVAGQGQLWSFSRFKAKDPFVQQVQNATTTGSAASASGGTGATKGGTTGAGTPVPVFPGGTPVTPAGPTVFAYATLMVNGRPQQLTLKQLFPRGDPMFVLLKLEKKTARIGVAGGAFTKGGTLAIEIGKPVTLMNTTTGQRYVVKLVYVGITPEIIAGFKGGKPAPTATTAPTTSTTTP